MTIWLICGRQGSGKSLLCASMCHGFYKAGKTVYSNIAFNFPYKQLDYSDIINCRLQNAVIYLDEAHLILPRRNSLKSTSKVLVDNFISMSSKQNLTLIFSTQFPQKIDGRISELEKDYNVLCEKYIYDGTKWAQTSKDAHELGNTPTIIAATIEQVYDRKISKLRLIANNYYNLYNRYEIINIRGLEEADEIRKAKLKIIKTEAVKKAMEDYKHDK